MQYNEQERVNQQSSAITRHQQMQKSPLVSFRSNQTSHCRSKDDDEGMDMNLNGLNSIDENRQELTIAKGTAGPSKRSLTTPPVGLQSKYFVVTGVF
jgi:hypothetical protein